MDFLNRSINTDNFLLFLKKRKWIIITCLILSFIISYYMTGIFQPTNILVNIAIVFFLIILTAKCKILNVPIIIITSLIISGELAYVIINEERISTVILSSIVDTQIKYGLSVAKLILLLAIPISITLAFLFLKSASELRKSSFSKLLLISSFLFLVVIYDVYQNVQSRYNVLDERGKQDFASAPLLLLNRTMYYNYPLVLGDTAYLLSYINEMRKIKNNSSHSIWPKDITLAESRKTPTKVIVVLGETSLRTHYSVYGYQYPTTPFLDSLYKSNKISVIHDVISGAPITRESIRLTLSFSTPFKKNDFYKYKNTVEMAKMAGYQTHWLSTTHEMGLYNTYVGMIGESSDIFLDSTKNDLLKTEEDLVLPQLLKEYYIKDKKQFFVLHLQGSHDPYVDRYDQIDKDAITTTPEATKYDRSIHHTDRVLKEIIKVIQEKDEDTIMYYISDHGEIINVGHGMIYGGGPLQYSIPFIIYQHKNELDIESLVQKYRSSNGILNIINTHYMLPEIMGFNISQQLVEQAKEDGLYVYHSDGFVYKYNDIESGKAPCKIKDMCAAQ